MANRTVGKPQSNWERMQARNVSVAHDAPRINDQRKVKPCSVGEPPLGVRPNHPGKPIAPKCPPDKLAGSYIQKREVPVKKMNEMLEFGKSVSKVPGEAIGYKTGPDGIELYRLKDGVISGTMMHLSPRRAAAMFAKEHGFNPAAVVEIGREDSEAPKFSREGPQEPSSLKTAPRSGVDRFRSAFDNKQVRDEYRPGGYGPVNRTAHEPLPPRPLVQGPEAFSGGRPEREESPMQSRTNRWRSSGGSNDRPSPSSRPSPKMNTDHQIDQLEKSIGHHSSASVEPKKEPPTGNSVENAWNTFPENRVNQILGQYRPEYWTPEKLRKESLYTKRRLVRKLLSQGNHSSRRMKEGYPDTNFERCEPSHESRIGNRRTIHPSNPKMPDLNRSFMQACDLHIERVKEQAEIEIDSMIQETFGRHDEFGSYNPSTNKIHRHHLDKQAHRAAVKEGIIPRTRTRWV